MTKRPRTPADRAGKCAVIAVTIAAIVIGLVVWRTRTSTPAAAESIAVLPFLNLTGDAAEDHLGDGISEELTETLAEFNDLRVVARTSAFQYKGKSVDVREVGRNLRAREAVLEGSVVRRGGQFRVIAQLIRSSDGYHLWSHTYDGTLAEVPAMEAGIARAAREKLAPATATAGSREVITRSPEAHDLYLRAAYEMKTSAPRLRRGRPWPWRSRQWRKGPLSLPNLMS